MALVGVQSHQLHRALDLAALAADRGAMTVIGGPHPMTCDTTDLQGRGVAFALSEAELIWHQILSDAIRQGELAPVYGGDRRWHPEIDPPALIPPSRRDLKRYASRMLGVYPARGCPYRCNFCSIIKIAGHEVRSQPVETTIASLRAAERVGAQGGLLRFGQLQQVRRRRGAARGHDRRAHPDIPFFVQCDVQVYRQPELIELLGTSRLLQHVPGRRELRPRDPQVGQQGAEPPFAATGTSSSSAVAEQGIATTFANILGFPQDTEAKILDHLAALREIGPEMAAFYVLTPIPGTEQYAEFLEQRPDLRAQPGPVRRVVPHLAAPDVDRPCSYRTSCLPLLSGVLRPARRAGQGPRRQRWQAPSSRQSQRPCSSGCWRTRWPRDWRRRVGDQRGLDGLLRRRSTSLSRSVSTTTWNEDVARYWGFELAPTAPNNLTLSSARRPTSTGGPSCGFAEGPLRLAVS